MGWLIDPDEKLVFVCFADRRITLFESVSDRLPVPDFAAFLNLTLGELFDWLVD
jgi:Uma2 family endonuclease